jgi:hypothetical protein
MDLVRQLCEASANLVKVFPHEDRPVREMRPVRVSRPPCAFTLECQLHGHRLLCARSSARSVRRYARGVTHVRFRRMTCIV